MIQINQHGKNAKKITKVQSNPYGKIQDDTPKIFKLFENEGQVNQREKKYAHDLQLLQNKHQGVLQSARQIFAIAVNCLQHLDQLKNGAPTDKLGESIDNYKV